MMKLDLRPSSDRKPAISCVVQFLDEQRVSLKARTSSGDILTENSDYYIITIGSYGGTYDLSDCSRSRKFFFFSFLLFGFSLSIGCVRVLSIKPINLYIPMNIFNLI